MEPASRCLGGDRPRPPSWAPNLCDLTVACCRTGDLEATRSTACELADLYAQHREDMMHPQYILWAGAQAARCLGDDRRAGELLAQAYDAMQQHAAAISDPVQHASYYRLPFNRQIQSARDQNMWP